MTSNTSTRLYYIDNIRILLITLIALLHLAITYGAPGDWYYNELQFDTLDPIAVVLFSMFNATVQAFTLGFFFMISGYFTPGSYDRKGTGSFIKARFLRLGIPLLFQIIVIQPVLVYTLWGEGRTFNVFFVEYIRNIRSLSGVGPLWFVEALLFFNIMYVLWRFLRGSSGFPSQNEIKVPGNIAIALFALIVGLVSFTVRIWLPVGWNFEFLNLQFPFFPQYICMFIIGIIAYRGNWFSGLTDSSGKVWQIVTVILIVSIPAIFVLGEAREGVNSFMGGLKWQALFYALWEQFVCVGMVIGISVLFRKLYNQQGSLAKTLSASAYTVFIIHAPVLVFLALALKGISLYPLIKFVLVAPLAVSLCFAIATVIRKLPLARKIL